MFCKIPGCQQPQMLVKGSGPTTWTRGDSNKDLKSNGCPITNPKPLDICYFHHKKSLGLFDTEPEDYMEGGKYYAQGKGIEFYPPRNYR